VTQDEGKTSQFQGDREGIGALPLNPVEYGMGYLSKYLAQYLRSAEVDPQTPVKVVLATSQAAPVTIGRVPTTAEARSEALEALRAAGIGGNALSLPGLTPRRLISGINAVTVQVPASELEALAASPGVEYIRPERLHRAHLNTSPTQLGVISPVRSRFDGARVRVAVIDSGIDANHPDLRGRVNLTESQNFTQEGSQADVTDLNGHGTHVAGIIGGAGATFQGVAPQVELIACKVFTADGSAREGAVLAAVRWAIDHQADVINYSGGFAPVDRFGRPIIPPPWVWPEDLVEEEMEFKRAMDSGIVAVVSAGNEGEIGRRGTLSMPATCPQVMSIGAVDKQNALARFSSVGPAFRSARVSRADIVDTLTPALKPHTRAFDEVDMLAPGGAVDPVAGSAGGCFFAPGIISALSANAVGQETACFVEDQYVRMSGTSQAAPHIAGLAALILQAAAGLGANLGARRAFAVKGILRAACTRVPRLRRTEQGQGIPRWDDIERILRDIASGARPVNDLM
jgi:Subtilase family